MMEPGFAIWLTGLPASGKTTLARELAYALSQLHIQAQLLDADELRDMILPAPTFSPAEQDLFYRSLAVSAQLLTANGVPVIIAATGPKESQRALARQQIRQFVEVYLQCSPETCRERDKKGIYRERETEATLAYESPRFPEVTIDTDALSVATGVQQIISYLKQVGVIQSHMA